MEVSELRIGNLVKIKTSNDAAFYPVYAIDGMGLKVVLGGCRQCEGWKDEKLLKPIPITEELLLKYGFKWNKIYNAYEHEDMYVLIGINTGESYWKINISNSIPFDKEYDNKLYLNSEMEYHVSDKPIEYLHQLQNIYYFLTGKELEVTI